MAESHPDCEHCKERKRRERIRERKRRQRRTDYYARKNERAKALHKERCRNDPEYREKHLARQREYQKKYYQKKKQRIAALEQSDD